MQSDRALSFYRIAEVRDKLFHQRPRPIAVLIFASAHDKLDLDLVAVLQEFQRLFPANVKVMVADRQRKPDAFQFHFLLLGFILALLPLQLVGKLAEINNPAYRRLGDGRNLDEIQAALAGLPDGILERNNPDLLVVFVNKPDFGNADLVVNAETSLYGR